MKFLLPTGIGDSVWALHKIQSICQKLGGGPIDVWLSCTDPKGTLDRRAVDFVRRFPFVHNVDLKPYVVLQNPPITPEGYWNYIPDGRYEFGGESCVALMPNAALERGTRLENWLPQYEIDWAIFTDFHISWREKGFGNDLHKSLGDYAVFYLGPLGGNTSSGHNRGGLWSPAEWVELGRRIHREFRLKIVVVGASYDSAYANLFVYPLLNGDASFWTNLVGETTIGKLFSVTSNAKFVMSYQAGVGIVSTYLGTPTAIFWRPKGNSIITGDYLSFEEEMASAWVPPSKLANGTHLPLIYGRHGVDYIMQEIRSRGWA